MFQQNAWADTKISEDWVKSSLSITVKDLDEYVLFCNNLKAQTSDEFKAAVRKTGGIVWFDVPNGTNVWQPVDCSYGQLYKSQIAITQQQWLEHGENVEKWVGNQDKFTASDGRNTLGWRSAQTTIKSVSGAFKKRTV